MVIRVCIMPRISRRCLGRLMTDWRGEAVAFLRRTSLPLEPRKQWPTGGLPQSWMLRGKYAFRPAGIYSPEKCCACGVMPAGVESVRQGKYRDGRFCRSIW